MKICEDCIKKDVCKFMKKVEKYEEDTKPPEPLESNVGCKYKRTEPSNWHYTTTSGTTWAPHIDTTTTTVYNGDDIHAFTCN